MRTVRVSAASPLDGYRVHPAEIRIEGDVTDALRLQETLDGVHWEESAARFYDAEALRIVDVLATTLPQATLHRVLVLLLQRSAPFFQGPLERSR